MEDTHLTSPARKQRIQHTPDVREQIRQDWLAGASFRELGEHYGVHRSTISEWAKAEGWTRPTPPRLKPPAPPGPTAAEITSLDELVNSAVAGILKAYNEGRTADAREQAKAAEIYNRLRHRLLAGSAGRAPADPGDLARVFTPERDVFEILAEHGLTAEDLR